MKNRTFSILLTALVALGLGSMASAQYVPGAQPVVYPTYQPAASAFTAASQTGTAFTSSALRSAVIQVVGQPLTAAMTGVVSGTTTSIETWTSAATGDAISGTINVTPLTKVPCVFTFPVGTSKASAVTLFNANTTCNTTDGLTASTSTTTFLITQGGTSLTITDNGSTLLDNKAWTTTWALQGSIDGVNWYSVPTAALPTTSVPITTTAITQTTAVTTQTATLGTAYVANVAGFNHFQFVTTSATFTSGASIAISFSGAPHASFF